MRDDWEKNNKALSDKMRRMSKDLNEKSESVQYTVFEAMQTIMDYIEESFENVMLPCTPGKALEGLESVQNLKFCNMSLILARYIFEYPACRASPKKLARHWSLGPSLEMSPKLGKLASTSPCKW